MASIAHLLLPLILICFCTISMSQQRPFLPNSVILPVTKDIATHQYVTQIYIGDQPLAPTKLVIDLAGSFSWIDSSATFLSSSQHPNPISSCSLQCSMTKANSCSKGNKTCTLQPENPITNMVTRGELTEEIIAVQVTDGIKTGSLASIPHFLFSSAPALLLKGLGDGVKGILGLGNTKTSLPSQVADAFGFHRKFSLCLSSSNGVMLSGQSPYLTVPNSDISKSLMYTPLVVREGSKLQGYYINVKSIKINGKKLLIKESLLSVNQEGAGGTKISTTVPYTTMESTLYYTFIEAYIKAAIGMNMTMTSPMAPFGVCFSSEGVKTKRVGLNVPLIDLVLQSEMVKWRIQGRNSMVQVNDQVMCLGFLDGGLSLKASIVIGGYQLEENVLEFNLGTSMLGFHSSLVMPQTTCSNLRHVIVQKSLGSTHVGPGVPSIEFVLQSKRSVFWTIFGANSVFPVIDDVLCLGYVDRGVDPPGASITIGGYQLENALLQFDLARSRLGFMSTILDRQTTYAIFNFTSKALRVDRRGVESANYQVMERFPCNISVASNFHMYQ